MVSGLCLKALSHYNVLANVSRRMKYIEDIYFFEVNTKYISSSAVKKNQYFFHECVARVKMLIFSQHEMKYILYLP